MSLSEQRLFPLEKYSLNEQIGQGGFAKVFKCTLNDDDPPSDLPRNVAVKVLDVSSDFFSSADLSPMLEMPGHENVVRVFDGIYRMDKQLLIVMELCQANLKDFASNNALNEALMIKFSIEAVRAVKHIHRNHHIHRYAINSGLRL